MKKVAVILIIAVLALGCLFASDTTANGKGIVVVEVKVPEVLPLYKITASAKIGGSTATEQTVTGGEKNSATASSTDSNVISGTLAKDESSVTVSVVITEYPSDTTVDYLRCKKISTIEISTGDLKNVKATATANTEVGPLSDTAPTVTYDKDTIKKTINGVDNTETHSITDKSSATNGTVSFKVNQFGYEVECTQDTGLKLATWDYEWDTTGLMAGETYRTDITLTYTVE